MNKNTVVIHNPIFYDLGLKFEESLETIDSIEKVLREAFPGWQESDYKHEFLAYNFSYLSLHIPRIKFIAEEKVLRVRGVDVKICLMVVFRINGTLCFEYKYEVEDSDRCELNEIVNEIQAYINVDYKDYLKRKNAYINSMTKIEYPGDVIVPAIFKHGLTLDLIKGSLKSKKIGTVNSYVYPYQHGRILYSFDESNDKAKRELFTDEFIANATVTPDGGVYVDTWKTIIFTNLDKNGVFLELYYENLTNFFLCQTWIFHCEHLLKEIDEKSINEEHSYTDLNDQAEVIETLYFSCNRKMINFINLSIPFKNDYYTELSKVIIDALKLDSHIHQTHKHFLAIKEHINIVNLHSDTRKEKNTRFLKIFMALNLSAGIASLIPTSLDGDLSKFGTSIIPTLVWLTFGLIAFVVFYLESKDKR